MRFFRIDILSTLMLATLSAVLSSSVLAVDASQAPQITSPLSADAIVGLRFNYTISGSNTPISFNALGLPPGLTIDTGFGLITGVPLVEGTFTVSISASNQNGTDTRDLTLFITGTGEAPAFPILTRFNAPGGIVGSPYNFQIGASGSPNVFGAVGLPPGLSIEPSTGLISGTPLQAGTFSVGISATNAAGTVTAVTPITILGPVAANAPPVFISPAAVSAITGEAFSYQVAASGDATFSVVNLPAGLTFDPATGLISGTPASAGAFQFTITASNAFGTTTQTVTLTVVPPFFSNSNQDSDGDGFPDELEVRLGSSPFDPNSTPFGGSPAGTFTAADVSGLGIRLNFAQAGLDTLTLNTRVPVAEGFAAANQTITLDIGGVVQTFTLNDRGSAKENGAAVNVRVRSGRKGNPGTAQISLRIARANLAAALADEGLTNSDANRVPRIIPVFVFMNMQAFRLDADVLYTARQGRAGVASAVRIRPQM